MRDFQFGFHTHIHTSVKAPKMMTSEITVLLSNKRKHASSSGSALMTFFNIYF